MASVLGYDDSMGAGADESEQIVIGVDDLEDTPGDNWPVAVGSGEHDVVSLDRRLAIDDIPAAVRVNLLMKQAERERAAELGVVRDEPDLPVIRTDDRLGLRKREP